MERSEIAILIYWVFFEEHDVIWRYSNYTIYQNARFCCPAYFSRSHAGQSREQLGTAHASLGKLCLCDLFTWWLFIMANVPKAPDSSSHNPFPTTVVCQTQSHSAAMLAGCEITSVLSVVTEGRGSSKKRQDRIGKRQVLFLLHWILFSMLQIFPVFLLFAPKKASILFIPLLSTLAKAFWAAVILLFFC